MSPNDDDTIYKYEMPVCHSEYQVYFTAVLLGIQGILLIFGAFLAWQTRKVGYVYFVPSFLKPEHKV